ncbi:hypothetical protein ATG66_3937 [Vibrio sp. ES.051]|uniref:putative Ig domain-containing protein n=1 Tax=Vibrio sp. ES.051 TaxID=1761909 RepID=UPI000BF5A7F2|nr:putative Ig domain-containing protein [Vibrio sp. ES.051]PFG45640.1 hypothetical protein ATG66_3937 [Vibrio sp. ES.051]
MKKLSLLAASVAIALTGCGGSDGGSSDSTPAPGGLVITAIDGYLQQAQIWVDEDGNRSNGCELNTGELTDENGQATISKADFAGMDVCIKAVANTTIDKDRGLVASGFTLASLANDHDQIIVNPMTNMVVAKVKSQLAGDPTLDVVAAKKAAEDEVVAAVTQSGSGLKADAAMIFGDYIANSSTSDEAKALKVIGETLVDHKDQSVEKQLAITTAVAEKTQEIINSNAPEEIDDFAPEINVSGDGTVTVTKNSRPVVSNPLTPVTMQLSDAFTSMDASQNFSDAEGDTLTFSMQAIGGNTNGLAIDATTGVITGKPKAAGEFIYQIFAEDAKGSLSYPATLTVTIETPNTAPTLSEPTLATLQTELNARIFTQGEAVNEVITSTGLFQDVDGDKLTYTASNVPSGMTVTLTDNQLMLTGTPTVKGANVVTLSAKDEINHTAATANITINIKEAVIEPTLHPLEGKTWYRLEHGGGTDSISFDYSRIWCDSIRFEDGQVLGNHRDLTNLIQCGDIATESFSNGTYVIEGNTLIATFAGENGTPETAELTVSDADAVSTGAKSLQWKYADTQEIELYTLFSNKVDAEARIQIQSDDIADKRMFPMTLPTAIEGQYATGKASVSLLENTHIGDDGMMDANLILEFDNQDFTCADVSEFYQSMRFTGEDLSPYGVDSIDPSTNGFECYNNVENSITHAAIDFDLPQLTKNEVYSFVGKVKPSQGAFIEAVKFNIKWTGQGNNE